MARVFATGLSKTGLSGEQNAVRSKSRFCKRGACQARNNIHFKKLAALGYSEPQARSADRSRMRKPPYST